MAETAELIRGADGRFVVGHKYIGGSAIIAERTRKMALIAEATTDDEVLAVWAQIKRDALAGSVADKQMFLTYILGRPEPVDAKEAVKTFDAINLNRPSADLTPEQRRARIAYLIAERAKETK